MIYWAFNVMSETYSCCMTIFSHTIDLWIFFESLSLSLFPSLLYLFLSLTLFIPHSLFHNTSLNLPVSFSLSLTHYFSFSYIPPSISFNLSPLLSPLLTLSLHLYFSFFHISLFSLYFSLPQSFSFYQPLFLFHSLSLFISFSLFISLYLFLYLNLSLTLNFFPLISSLSLFFLSLFLYLMFRKYIYQSWA